MKYSNITYMCLLCINNLHDTGNKTARKNYAVKAFTSRGEKNQRTSIIYSMLHGYMHHIENLCRDGDI